MRWRVRFSKWHALGNSYLVVERADSGVLTADQVRLLCDVDRGIGSDGVLEIVAYDGVSAEIVIWNPDGSTAEMSGNGTRIAARWLADFTGESEVVIRVGPRTIRARMIDDIDVATDIGEVDVGAIETIDVNGETVELTPVLVGNPHAVVRCDDPTRELLLRLGPPIENHSRFPERTNVQLVRPVSRHEIAALVWERGAGETAASGSSATAVAAAAIANGWCESPVTVRMPGGDVVVTFADNHAILVGPAVEIYAGMMARADDDMYSLFKTTFRLDPAQPEVMRQHDADIADLRRVQDELRDMHQPLSPKELVRAWIAIVAIVEVGYGGREEEYANDLMTRDYIGELCRRLPGRWAELFERWIAPWDERFRAATVEETEPHLPDLMGSAGWWQYRSPRLWPGKNGGSDD